MEIDTCEKFVLTLLANREKENENLAARLNATAKVIHDLLEELKPTLNEEEHKFSFEQVEQETYVKYIDTLNKIFRNEVE